MQVHRTCEEIAALRQGKVNLTCSTKFKSLAGTHSNEIKVSLWFLVNGSHFLTVKMMKIQVKMCKLSESGHMKLAMSL